MTDPQRAGATAEPTETVEVLCREECLKLIGSAGIGRLAVPTLEGSPFVVPVNYVLDGDVIVFRADPGRKLFALRQSPVSFQVDTIDPYHRSGWSVLVQGIAYEATPTEVEHLTIEPWAPGDKRHWVRLLPRTVSGRRVRPPAVEADPRGYL